MQVFLTLTRREVGAFLVSLTGYVVIAAAVFQMGLSYVILLTQLQSDSTPIPLVELFYSTPFFWLIVLMCAPVITMRLFAAEKASGTFEALMTAPVGDLQVVLAKFAAAVIFYMVMWLPLLVCIVVLRQYSSDSAALDYGAVAGTFLGILLLGCLFIAAGCFASSLTRSQIVAAMMTFAFCLALFVSSFLADRFAVQRGWVTETLTYINVVEHMQDFVRGTVDSRAVIFYVTSTLFFLFLTYRAVESRRWK
jgi:ABC-2 type transport system permease protein